MGALLVIFLVWFFVRRRKKDTVKKVVPTPEPVAENTGYINNSYVTRMEMKDRSRTRESWAEGLLEENPPCTSFELDRRQSIDHLV